MNMLQLARRGFVMLAIIMLAACTASAPRTDRAAPSATIPPPPVTENPTPEVTQPAPAANRVAESSPWARMRARFRMPGCDYSSEVLKRAQRYAREPQRFAASWRPAMPFLLLALDAIERRDLPGEFALLPYVESTYRPLHTQGMRPAGVWQLMPHTARDQGLRIAPDYDGRLDMPDATRVALDLLERYDRAFGDWRLATMAFNAGEYRVRREVSGRPARALDATTLARLKLHPITHEHLAKLLALSCIVADPERFAVELPEPRAADRLVVHPIEGSIDLRIAARFAGMPVEELRRLNAAHLDERSAAEAPSRLLLPADRVTQFVALEAEYASLLHAHWQPDRATHETRIEDLAVTVNLPVRALALANGIAPDARLAAGSTLLLPGQPRKPGSVPEAAPEIHIVRRGDTLSALAKRYRVRIAELLDWNALRATTTLRLGTPLRVRGR